jgi:hypothetical protein
LKDTVPARFSDFLPRGHTIAPIHRLTTAVIPLGSDWSLFRVNRTKEELEEYNYAIACWKETADRSTLQSAKDMYNNTARELEIERDTGNKVVLTTRV